MALNIFTNAVGHQEILASTHQNRRRLNDDCHTWVLLCKLTLYICEPNQNPKLLNLLPAYDNLGNNKVNNCQLYSCLVCPEQEADFF